MTLEIREFQHNDIEQVADLLALLWGGDKQSNKIMLQWKYFDLKPFNITTAYVGLDNHEIIGFRGYFPSFWGNGTSLLRVLTPSDAVVAPKFRRKGFFSSLTTYSIKALETYHDLFLNTSSNTQSVPGYLKLSWKKLCARDFVYKIFKFRVSNDFYIRDSEEIMVLDSISFEDITHLLKVKKATGYQQTFTKEYFEWRYNRPFRNYVFVLLTTNSSSNALLVLERSNQGRVLDYYDLNQNYSGIKRIIKHIRANSSISSLKAYKNYNSNDKFGKICKFIQIPGNTQYKNFKKTRDYFLYRGPKLDEPGSVTVDPACFSLRGINADGA